MALLLSGDRLEDVRFLIGFTERQTAVCREGYKEPPHPADVENKGSCGAKGNHGACGYNK